jgi:F0F1-type ATP synthase membrane subunit b/b'
VNQQYRWNERIACCRWKGQTAFVRESPWTTADEAWIIAAMMKNHAVSPQQNRRSSIRVGLLSVTAVLALVSCKPDDSPFKAENETLRKQLSKQESLVTSLQDGNKVMQQQIDLLNQEIRDAKKAAESAKGEARAAAEQLESQLIQARKLTADIKRTAIEQAAQSIRIESKGAQAEDIPRPLSTVAKTVEEALARNGYQVKVSITADQKAVFVTERKVSNPASLEVAGFRNQYVVSLQAQPSNVTRLSVKADFEKLAQGGRILSVSAEETAEIERRFIGEVSKALAASSKT